MIIENNKVIYYLQKNKPVTNIVFITDDEDILIYADYKKYFGIYISKDFFNVDIYKKYAHIVAKDIIAIEEMVDSYIVSVSSDILYPIVSILSLPVYYLDNNFVKMQINSILTVRQ